MSDLMTPEAVEALFTRDSGEYLFARWGRPIVPVVFGVEDETLEVVKGALEAVMALAGHQMAETDPELGVNCMFFFFREWDELLEVPDLDRLIEGLGPLVAKLKAAEANQYRVFRFDEQNAIKAAFVFVRMDGEMAKIPAETLALGQVVQTVLLWSDAAFRQSSPLAKAGDRVILRPDIAGVIRAGYDPVMPAVSRDPTHALRLAARLSAPQ
jgi:hypothetical protein